MPKANTIVAPIVRITPPFKKERFELIREIPPEGFFIEFKGNLTAKLPPEERSLKIIEVLEGLRKLSAPVYVDIHPETRAIIRLLIPHVGRFFSILDKKEDKIWIELEMSSARHFLNRKNPEFNELMKQLQNAMKNKTIMIITETDNHEIIDIRQFSKEFKLPPTLPPSQLISTLHKKKGRWLRWFGCRDAISKQKAMEMFYMVSSKTCDPLTVPPPCIPFLYPDDGCWARAHEMYRLMMEKGVISKKVWIYGNLHVKTANNPSCEVYWGWHVAPIVCVRSSCWFGWFIRKEKVIDPSLFSEPVSKATWKSVQDDPDAELIDTEGSVYYHSYSGYTETDPTYEKTNYILNFYRLQLQTRSIYYGPPPYSGCS